MQMKASSCKLDAKTLLPNLAASTCSTRLHIFTNDLRKLEGQTQAVPFLSFECAPSVLSVA
jgi:hypothetical protein